MLTAPALSACRLARPRLLVYAAARQVPVFIFELDRDEPVLIDQHYNARALEDLVMVVQNAANQYVSAHPCFTLVLVQTPALLQHLSSCVLKCNMP
jgi:hypothetical protein